MSRLVSIVTYALLMSGFGLATCLAQVPVQLKLKPERMRHARAVEQRARAANDSLLLAEAWYLYGKTYVFAGDYQMAQAYFMKSLRVHEPRGDSFELSRLYVRLSENEGRLGRPAESLRLAALSLAVAQRIHSDKALIRSYGALGRVYESMWDGRFTDGNQAYRHLRAIYKKREELCYKLNDSLGIAETSVELGMLLTRVRNPQAIAYLQKALALFTLRNEAGVMVNAMVQLAAAYSMVGKSGLAFQTLQKAEKLYESRRLDEYDIRLALEKNYVAYFRSVGQWKAAFAHQEKRNALEQSQLLADNDGAITRLNIEYQTEKREAMLLEQKKDIALRSETLRTQQSLTMAISVLLVMATGMSLVFFRLNRRNKRISRRNVELVKEQNHRVKNNLQVVASLLSLQSKRLTDEAAKKAVDESRLRVQSMAILHRRLYDGDKLAEASLDAFIREVVGEVLKAYGYTTVRPRFFIDPISLSADKAVPLGLILNELTTNACKYAFPKTDNPCYFISCRRNKRIIEFKVADNGPGWADTRLDDANDSEENWITRRSESINDGYETMLATRPVSFGMQLIQAQVEQLAGKYSFTNADAVPTGIMFILEFKG